MTHLQELDVLMNALNSKYLAYKDDVRFHKGWKNEETCVEKSKQEVVAAAYKVVAELLPEPASNARDLGELRIYAPVGLDDIDALIRASDLPCDHSNSN